MILLEISICVFQHDQHIKAVTLAARKRRATGANLELRNIYPSLDNDTLCPCQRQIGDEVGVLLAHATPVLSLPDSSRALSQNDDTHQSLLQLSR
jgi:hypothetical protein